MSCTSRCWKATKSRNGLVYVQERNCPIAFVVETNDQQIPNAQLMAAAPELLEACKGALRALAEPGRAKGSEQVTDLLQAAIANAESPSSPILA